MSVADTLPDNNFGLDLTGRFTLRLPADSIEDFGTSLAGQRAIDFVDYLADRKGLRRTFTWGEWEPWTRAVAHRLSTLAERSDRVAIMAPQGPEYVAGFHAALRAGVIAVPLFQPDLPGHGDRLEAVFDDCRPSVVITTAEKRELVENLIATRDWAKEVKILLPADLLGEAGAADAAAYVRPPDLDLDDIAYLQYTSGSTRVPAGVELTHLNLVYNVFQICQAYDMEQYLPDANAVSWLPLFHDMGLLLGAGTPAIIGAPIVLMDPISFVMKPTRWFTEMAKHTNVLTAGPNFAYALTVKKLAKQEGFDELDLSQIRGMVNGAEPVLVQTLETVDKTLGPRGLPANANRPSYGLAEATLFVTAPDASKPLVIIDADIAALQQGTLTSDPGSKMQLVSCGRPLGLQVLIVDPDTLQIQPDGGVGEIWIHGPNIGRGYWGKPEESKETFGGELTAEQAAAANVPQGPWLRTGDLGALIDGDLFITGRQKDLIIIDGRNIYPHDVEYSVEHAHEAIALHRLAAFSIQGPDGAEAIVAVAERFRGAEDAGQHLAEIDRAVRDQLSREHSVSLHEFVLIDSDTIPWTSSGKIARNATRDAYLAGTLSRVTP